MKTRFVSLMIGGILILSASVSTGGLLSWLIFNLPNNANPAGLTILSISSWLVVFIWLSNQNINDRVYRPSNKAVTPPPPGEEDE